MSTPQLLDPNDTVVDPPAPAPIALVPDEVLARAVQLSLITLAQAERVRPSLGELGDAGAMIDALLERGLLGVDGAAQLHAQADDFVEPFPGYRLVRELGRGGMGVVFEAIQTRLERRVALKVVEPGLAPSREYLRRFEREARTLARLNHPNIVQVYDYGSERGRIYIALELVEGEDVTARMARDGRLERGLALRITLHAARGLAHAHSAGIIHRDIKPANLLLQEDGDRRFLAKVTDLGLARSEESAELTRVGTIMGTPAYMAPEQAEGSPVDHRADIYALGATLYHMLTGERPFQDSSAMKVLLQKQTERLPDPRRLCDAVDDELLRVLDRMLARVPEQRYPSYRDLIADLERLTSDEPAAIEPLEASFSSLDLGGVARPARRFRRVRPRRFGGLAWAAAALFAAGLLWTQLERTQLERTPPRSVADVQPAPGQPAGEDATPPASEPWVALTSEPVGAALWIDGVAHGSTPARLRLAPGAHRLVARAPGHRDLELSLPVEGELERSVHLAPIGRPLQEGALRLTRLPEGMKRFPPLLNLRSRRLHTDWSRLGSWEIRSTRQQLAAGQGGLVGEGQADAPALAEREGFAQLDATLSDNGAAGWRLSWRVAAEPGSAAELRLLRRGEEELVLGFDAARVYLGLRTPQALRVLRAEPCAEPPTRFRLDWDGAIASASWARGRGELRVLHGARRADPQQHLTLAVLAGQARFSDLALQPLLAGE